MNKLKIVDMSQTNRFSGWKQSEKKTNRYWLIDQLTTNPFSLFRQAIYDYHSNGLDLMVNLPEVAKQTISSECLRPEKLIRKSSK